MKQRVSYLFLLLLVAVALLLTACGGDDPLPLPDPGPDDSAYRAVYTSYLTFAEENNTEPMSYEDWLASIRGAAGADGLTPYIGENGNWWIGKTDTGIKAAGSDGKDGQNGSDGKDGVSISSVDKTATNGKTDTYTITYSDGTTSTFTVTNGADGQDGAPGADGKDGQDGAPGADGVGIATATVNAKGELVLTFSNGTEHNLGKVVGEKGTDGANGQNGQNGADGKDGKDGVGIASATVTEEGKLVLTLTNDTTIDLGVIKGADGKDGQDGTNGTDGKDGISVTKTEINEKGELILTYSNNTSTNLGVIKGADGKDGQNGTNGTDGKDGADGVGIETVTLDDEGNLSVTLTSGTTLNLGNVKGADGKDGQDGTDGKDGIDGTSVTGAQINEKGELVFTFSDGTTKNVGVIVGSDGKDGQDGTDGKDGQDGTDGKDGVDGKNGIDGVGIVAIAFNEKGELVITLTDKTEINCGPVPTCIHAYGESNVLYAPNCTSIGVSVAVCEKCGYEQHTYMQALGHTYGVWYGDDPTCEEGAFRIRDCYNCDHSEINYISGLGHNYVDGKCQNCGDVVGTEPENPNPDDPSEGELAYEISADGSYYTVVGIGSFTGSEVVIRATYNGIPVLAIAEYAFNCAEIYSVTFEEGSCLTTIGCGAFANSTLKVINLPKTVTFLGENALHSCKNLTKITLPDSLASIDYNVFSYCDALSELVIPTSVTMIRGAFRFSGASDGIRIYYMGTEKEWQQVEISADPDAETTFLNATVYYYSYSEPTTVGNFWTYDENGNVKIWPEYAPELPPLETPEIVVPKADTAFLLSFFQSMIGEVRYFNGTVESENVNYRLATTTDPAQAVNVYLEAVEGVEGGYRMYFIANGFKTYIRAYERNIGKGTLELTTATPEEYYLYNDTYNTFLYTSANGYSYWMGTYNKYNTIGVSPDSYINEENYDASQFPVHFVLSENTEPPHVHVFDQVAMNENTICQHATCQGPAVYGYSCACGAVTFDATFSYGEALAHEFTGELPYDRYLVSSATCASPAIYAKSCIWCETASETETFTYGTAGSHKLVEVSRTEATCQAPLTVTYRCECGKEDTVTYTQLGDHAYTDPLITPPTCDKDGSKVYSCAACGHEDVTVLPATGEHDYVDGVCSACGRNESDCDHTDLHEEIVTLEKFGVCAPMNLVTYVCDCGEVRVLDPYSSVEPDRYCSFIEETEEDGFLEDGTPYQKMSMLCEDCGLRITMLATIKDFDPSIIEKGCFTQHADVTIEKDGNVLYEMTYEESEHNSEDAIIDLSEYGACGGYLTVFRCKGCGTVGDFGEAFEFNCFDIHTEPTRTENADGFTLSVSLSCAECGAYFIYEQVYTSIQGNYCHVAMSATFGVGDTVIATYSDVDYTHTCENEHDYSDLWDYTYDLHGESCSDGYTYTRTCKECGYTYSYENNYHQSSTEQTIPCEGVCGGTLRVDACSVCGQITSLNRWMGSCNFAEISRDELDERSKDGLGNLTETVTYQCSHCGLIYKEIYAKQYTSACTYEAYTQTIVSYGDTELLNVIGGKYGSSSSHNYEYTFEYLGDSCLDGYVVYARCAACGEERMYMDAGDHPDTVVEKIELTNLGVCKGYISYEKCVHCDTIIEMVDTDIICDMSGSVIDEYYDKDGNPAAARQYGTCLDCGLTASTLQIAEWLDSCTMQLTALMELYVGDECIFAYTETMTKEMHSYREFRIGESCDDGIEIIKWCTVCGDVETTHSWGCSYEYVCLDLKEYGGCGGYIEFERCTRCGKVRVNSDIDPECDMESGEWKSICDENGTVIGETYTCPKCGMVYNTYSSKEQISDCEILYSQSMEIVANGEVIFTFTDSYISSDHQYGDYIYEFDGESCEDGVRFERYCTVCGMRGESGYYNGHNWEYTSINLHDFGGCGGVISYDECVFCGELNVQRLAPNCPLGDGPEPTYITDESGIVHEIREMACPECGLYYVTDMYEAAISGCTVRHYQKVTISRDGEVIVNVHMNYDDSNHTYETEYKFYGTTCTEGVEVHRYCTSCGESNSYTTWNHETQYRETYLPEFGLCEGYLCESSCTICKSVTSAWQNGGCAWTYTEMNADGYNVYTCPDCGATKHERMTASEKNEQCQVTYYEDCSYYVDGVEVYRYSCTRVNAEHSYEVTYTLHGSSCEDGITVNCWCSACGSGYSRDEYDHNVRSVYKADGSMLGGCYFHYVIVDTCLCKQQYDLMLDYENLSYEDGRYYCPNCDFAVEVSTISKDEGLCQSMTYTTVTVIFGEDILYTYESAGVATVSHKFATPIAVTDPSGTVWVHAACGSCGMGCTSTAGEVIPSSYYSEVGKYCYLLRVTPLESGEYTIVSHTDFDTYVTLYEVRDGKYYEVASNDDGGLNTNFLLTYSLEAGVEYAFAIGRIGYDACYDSIDYVLSNTDHKNCNHETQQFLTSRVDNHIASDTVTVVNMDLCTECGAALTMQLVTSGNGEEEIELPVIPVE